MSIVHRLLLHESQQRVSVEQELEVDHIQSVGPLEEKPSRRTGL